MIKTDFDMRFEVLTVTTRKITAQYGGSISFSETSICIYEIVRHHVPDTLTFVTVDT
jgi:hypothetical protein